ncbi:MAG: multicopper oxidase domain-containing protein, partial [Desulfofustis sp.]|nr:multicopper oxidase domain-containing protein [Desulfofustis sp.]
MHRRDFIARSAVALGMAAFGKYGFISPRTAAAAQENPFSNQLYIPPLLEKSGASTDISPLSLVVQKGQHEFFSNGLTDTLGYNGSILGPTIRVRNKENVRLQVQNSIDQITTVHWHGLHVPAQWDGGPHQVIEPGEVWKPDFTINQQAATLWYHPHAMGLTGEHVYRGLAGLFIIEDEISDTLTLPRNYGVDDIPLIIQDRRFFEDRSFAYVRSMHDIMHGVLGNFLLVNGGLKPYAELPRGIARFRLLNGSNSSIYRFYFSDDQPFHVIASDGGFLSTPVGVQELILSAGERAEILFDSGALSPGDRLRLLVDQYSGNTYEAMELRISDKRAEQQEVVSRLREQSRLDESSADRTRNFAMETMSSGGRGMGMMGGNRLAINGKKMDMKRIDVTVPLGSTEIWEVENRSATMMQLPHSMHLHDVQFNILDRNGQFPDPIEAGRKDTVVLWPNDKVRLIAQFLDYTG